MGMHESDTARADLTPLNPSMEKSDEVVFATWMELSHFAMEEVRQASKRTRTEPGFRQGISLVINCGLGEAAFFLNEEPPPEREISFLPVHDAITMGWKTLVRSISSEWLIPSPRSRPLVSPRQYQWAAQSVGLG